jgi:hypothetical protein
MWSICTLLAAALRNSTRRPVYGSVLRVPSTTTQLFAVRLWTAVNCAASTSLRVSQPLCPPGPLWSSVQLWPNLSRW